MLVHSRCMRVSRRAGQSIRVVTEVDSLVHHALRLTKSAWHRCLKSHRLVHYWLNHGDQECILLELRFPLSLSAYGHGSLVRTTASA